MKDKLAVADRLEGRKLGIEPLIEPSSHFRHPPLLDHSGHATCDAIVQDASRKGQTDAQSRERRFAEWALGDPLRLRPAGNDFDLQGAENPLGVARHQPRMARRVASFQLVPQDSQAVRRKAASQLGANVLVARRDGADPGKQRAQVEAAAADHDRPAPARLDVGDRDASLAGELARRPPLARVEDVDQMVRDALALGETGLRGADVEASIRLERVGVDDLAVEGFGERHPERALAGRGRAQDDQEGGHTS